MGTQGDEQDAIQDKTYILRASQRSDWHGSEQ